MVKGYIIGQNENHHFQHPHSQFHLPSPRADHHADSRLARGRDSPRPAEIRFGRRAAHLQLGLCPVPRYHFQPACERPLHGQGGAVPLPHRLVLPLLRRRSCGPQKVNGAGRADGGSLQ